MFCKRSISGQRIAGGGRESISLASAGGFRRRLASMCNFCSLTSNQEAIHRLFAAKRERVGNVPLLPAIPPGNDAPLVRLHAVGAEERKLAARMWE